MSAISYSYQRYSQKIPVEKDLSLESEFLSAMTNAVGGLQAEEKNGALHKYFMYKVPNGTLAQCDVAEKIFTLKRMHIETDVYLPYASDHTYTLQKERFFSRTIFVLGNKAAAVIVCDGDTDKILGIGSYKIARLGQTLLGEPLAVLSPKHESCHEIMEVEAVALSLTQQIPGMLPLVAKEQSILFTKYCNLGDLLQWVRNHSATASVEVRRKIFFQICCTINRLHQNGWTHGDIKLENVLLSGNPSDPKAFLADVQCARPNGKEKRVGLTAYSTPPEAAGILADYYRAGLQNDFSAFSEIRKRWNQIYDDKVDIWALGVMLSNLLYGLGENGWSPGLIFLMGIGSMDVAYSLDWVCRHLRDVHCLQEPPKKTLQHLVWRMLHPDPTRRISVSETNKALQEFDSLEWSSSPMRFSKPYLKLLDRELSLRSVASSLLVEGSQWWCFSELPETVLKNKSLTVLSQEICIRGRYAPAPDAFTERFALRKIRSIALPLILGQDYHLPRAGLLERSLIMLASLGRAVLVHDHPEKDQRMGEKRGVYKTVRLGRDIGSLETLAILYPSKEEHQERFVKERAILRQFIGKPYVMQTLPMESPDSSFPVLVAEDYSAEGLEAFLSDTADTLAPYVRKDLFVKIAKAVCLLHQDGWVHGSIGMDAILLKPQNSYWEVALTKMIDARKMSEDLPAQKADIAALGVVLYNVLFQETSYSWKTNSPESLFKEPPLGTLQHLLWRMLEQKIDSKELLQIVSKPEALQFPNIQMRFLEEVEAAIASSRKRVKIG